MQDHTHIFKELGLTDSEALVYLTMLKGIVKPADIIKVTRLKRPTAYYALTALEKRGLISKSGKEGGKRFSVEPISRLVSIAQSQAQERLTLAQELEKMVPMLTAFAGGVERPTVSFYEGAEAVKNVIMESLYCKSRSVDVIAPNDNFFWQTGKKFVEQYILERGRRKIVTRSLWESKVEQSIVDTYYKGSEVRILPATMKGKFKTTTFLYDDKVLFISSSKNAYCLLTTSKELHDTLKAWFEALWEVSKK